MSESNNPELTNPDVVNWLWRMGVPLEHLWSESDMGWSPTCVPEEQDYLLFESERLGTCRFRIAQKK